MPQLTSRVRAVVLAVALLAGLLAAVPPAAAAAPAVPEGPAGDDFYTPPSPLPPGRPGDVIRRRTLEDTASATTYLVLYRSTDALGAPIAVSGTVAVPKGRPPGPVVGWAPGFMGLGDGCAPSKGGSAADLADPREEMLARGWTVASTDYEGLGTPGPHTYVVGRSEGHAVLDAVRAAQRLGAGVSSSAPVGLWGYSQGGGGAAWAAELAPSYAPDLKVRGTVAGGVPADMVAIARALDGSIAFGLLAAAASGYDAAYPELDLDRYLNARGRAAFTANASRCVVDVFTSLLFGRIADHVTANPLERPDWQARLRENSLGGQRPRAPIFLFHGIFDEVVPFAQADALHRTYCRAGANVTWSLQFGEHATSGITAQPDALRFMADRFAGKRTRGTCRPS